LNVFFRFFSILTIGLFFFNLGSQEIILKTIAGICEIIRLAFWNFFTIEYQHIKLFKKFSKRSLISCPFGIKLNISKKKKDYELAKIILLKELREKGIYKDLLINSNGKSLNAKIQAYKSKQKKGDAPSIMEESQWEFLSKSFYDQILKSL
jgi:hypothetical protein